MRRRIAVWIAFSLSFFTILSGCDLRPDHPKLGYGVHMCQVRATEEEQKHWVWADGEGAGQPVMGYFVPCEFLRQQQST